MASNRKFLLLCAFVASTVAVPVTQREQCARYCTEEGDFKLRPGSMYTYDYETTTTTTVQGSSQDKTQLQLTAQVDIEVISKCDLSLRLRGVTLKHSDPESPEYLNSVRGSRDFSRSVESHILRFSFQNGKVEHVCPSSNAPVWVTNLQKGVLSAFQTYILQPDWSTTADETDVLGKCKAEYQSLGTSWQGTHTIRKLKDLSTCTDRENVDTYLQGTPYGSEFKKKSLPLIKGSQECEQVIGQGFLQSSTCKEKLIFRPFSNGGSSVITSVTQKLSYSKTSQRTFTGNDYRPTAEPLLFRHADMEEVPSKRLEDAEAALRELCDESEQDISMTVPRKFSTFVYKLKKLQLGNLRNFYEKIEKICPTNTKSRKFFMDAIPLVATTDSAKFMYDLISRNEISSSESGIWLTSLSFVNEPTAETISVFTPLLDGRHDQAILGVSAMIHTFCKSNDCSNTPEIQNAVHKLFRNLGESCFGADDKKVILTLKALSNIGIMFGKENVLENCYKNPQIRLETRIAAIQAYRRVSCDTSRDNLMRLFSNYNEDPEIRIASYLAVMACPNPAVIDAVKDVLKGERINHVGSFVWTHLLALAKTKHPQRQAIRDIFSNLYLLNKYNSDARKFSTAREATFFLESIDSGFHVDTHLIFSTDSYLPRSAMFNLTVDVFGKTCNLFQIDGRMEGLEHLAESFFGPSGYFPQKNIAKLLREKRSPSYNKVEDMDNKFAAKSRFQQSPYGSLDVKIFGTTLWYNQFKDNGDATPDINLLEVVTKLAEDHEAEYSRSFQFLDTTFTVPMTSGLPLRIAVNGTASVALKYGGRFDVKSFEHVDVHGHIEPSGAVEIASLLTVEAGSAARSGLRVVGTMHSSTVLDGRLEIKNGEVVKAQLNMPRNRIDVFNLQSKVYLVHGNEEREPKVDKKGETNLKTCTGPTIGKLFGIELCSELRLPPYKPNSAIHPVNGPANFNIYIKKTDPSLKSYNFDAEWKLDVKNGEFIRHGVIAFNTPDSQTDRDVKAELYINHAERTASLKIKTPLKRMGANAKLISEKGLEKLALGLTVDDKDYFSLQTELRTTTDKSSITYMPSLEIRIPSRRLASVTGSLYLKHGQKYTGQLQIEDLTEKPILAKGNIEIGKRDRYDGEISINSYVLDGTVKGYAQLGDSMASRIQAEYKFLEGKTNKINIMGKMRDLSANALTKFNGLLNFQASLLPEWNTEIAFETMRTTGHIEDTLSISLGDGARSRVHSIRLQEILRYEGDLKNNKIDGSLSIVYPEKNIDYALKVNHENTEKSLKNVLDIQYGSRKHIMSEVVFNMNKDTPFSVAGDIKLKYPGRETALSASLSETSPKEYTATVLCKWQEGRQSSILINYKDKTDSSRLKYEVEGELNIPLRSPITFSSVIGTQSGQFAGFAEVNVGVDKYRAKVDYAKGKGNLNHRAKGELILNNKIYGIEAALQNAANKLSFNAEVKMPNRHRVIVKFEGRTGDFLQTGSFETLWDADRDTSKRFGINGELRSHADGYESKIVMQIRRRTITGTLSTSMKGRFLGPQWNTNNKIEVEWSPSEKATAAFSSNMLFDRSRQELNGVLEITTPYADYENLTLSLTHFYANQQWESELSTLLPKNNQIQFLTSGKYSFSRGGATFETKTQLQTSFSQLRDTYLELSHDHSTRELTSKMLLKWSPSKRITFDISAVAQPSVYKGALKLNSPFKNFEDISSEIVHNHSPDNFRTRLEFQWATRRKMSVNVEGRHVLNGRRRICTVSATGSFPHKDFENTQAKITYSNDGITLNTDMELHWSDRKKIVTSFTGSSRNSPYNRNIESKILVTTPFRNYESYQVSSSLETNRNSYKVNVDAQLPYRSSASFNSQGKVLSLNDIELNAVFVGQFPRYMQPQRASIDFVHKYENSKLRSTLDTSYNKYRLTVLLNGLAQIGYDNRNIEFSASINSPFSGFEEVKCNFIHNKRGFEYNTRLEASKNAVTGSLIHKLNIRDALNFETTFDASSSEFLDAKLSMIQVYREGQLEHNSYATWDRNKRINLNTQATLERHRSEITIDFTSPFEAIRSMKSSARYQTSVEGLSVMIATEWNRANRYLFEGEYKIGNRIAEGKLSLLTPFRGYRTVDIQSKLNYGGSRKSGDISLKWENGNKILFNSEYFVRRDGRALRINIQTSFDGYERISFDSAYKLVSGLYEGEVNAQVNRNVPYKANAFVKYGGEHILDFKINLESPDYRVRNLRMMVTVDSEENSYKELILKRINSSFVLNDKESTFSAIYHRQANEFIEGKINVATPYYHLRNLRIAAKVNTERNPSSSVNKITSSFVLNDQESTLSAEYRRENDQSSEVKINIASPDERLRNLRIRATVNTEKKASRRLTIHRIDSSAILNDKESTFTAEYHNEGNKFVQVNMRLDSPYRDYRTFSLQSSLRRESFESVDASLKLETPFFTLPKLDTHLQWNVDDSGCTFSFNCNTAEKRLNLQGKVSNRQFRPFTAVIEIDAPFLSFRKLSANADINIVRWDNSKIILSLSTPRSSHTLNLSLLQEDRNLNFQIKIESPSLPSNVAILTVKANYENENNIQTESSLQLMGKVHYLNGQLGRSDRSTEVQIRMESPLLPEKKAEITASLSRRRGNKILEGKANFISPSSNHEINMKYENKNSQITANLKIDSSLLEFSHFESEAKYTNSNGKDIEATFSASTPQKSFSFIGGLKNYDGEKYGQLKIECPCIDILKSFSITGTAKYDSFKSMEGSLSIGTNRKELRIAGNMKNDEWKDIEGFVTVNTPFEFLRMLRVDGRFRNDRFQNIDWSLNVETSNKNVPNLGVTSKISRTKGSEEISLMFHLPLRNYRTVQLLANAHYKPDFSSADSRITLTIPPNSKYSISGQYEVENPKLSGTAEVEYNGQKWVASGRLERAPENNDVSISFMTPNSDRYKFGGAYGVSGNKRFVAGSYISPSNAKYDVNTSISFIDLMNFEATIQAETPFYEYRNIEASIHQQYNSNFLSTNVDYLKNSRRGSLRIIHRNMRNSVTGSIHLNCPFQRLRDLKISYNHSKKSRDQECSLELDLNKVKQFKAELIQFGERSSHVIIDVPVLPLTMTADSKKLQYGRELNFKNTYMSRIVGFRTSYQREPSQILHDASFTWDERAEKRISYDFKLGETATGRELWSRLDTPLRSFMLKGNFTKANRASSGGIDFYWDASRTLEKHAAVGVEHTDMSSGRETSHRLKITVEHPKLSREIVQMNTISFSQNEFNARSELIYSRQRHHNLLLEVKTADLSRSRDSHYKGEFILRHPVTRLDIRALCEIIHNKLESFVNAKVNSVDMRQVQHVHELKGTLSKIKQQIDIAVRSDNDVKSILVSAANRNGRLEVSAGIVKNDEKLLESSLRLNSRNNSVELSITGAGQRGLHSSASYSKDFASARLWHDVSGNVITDVNVFLSLEQSRILKTQLNWRPKMWEELRITTGENLRAFISHVKERYQTIADDVSENVNDRLSLISRSLQEQLAPFSNEISNDVSDIVRDVKYARAVFERMYQNNEFFMKDISKAIEKAKVNLREIISGLSLAYEVLGNIIDEMIDEVYYTIYYALDDFANFMKMHYANTVKKMILHINEVKIKMTKLAHMYVEVAERYASYIQEKISALTEKAIEKVDKLVRAYAPFIIDSYYYIKNAADCIRNCFSRMYDRITNAIESNQYIVALKKYTASVLQTIQAFIDYDYAERAQEFFNQIYYNELLDSIINHPNVVAASELTNTALRKSVQIYHNLGLDVAVDAAVESVTNYGKEVFFNAVEELLSDIYEMKGGAKYEFAPHRGYVAVEVNLPTSRNSLVEILDFQTYPEYQKISSFKNTLTNEFYEDFCIWDYYYKILKYFSPSYWLPTFTGHAMIAGNQHYITFDKFSYDFAGKCSYLLARDFVDGNFTVIVNYGDDHIRKSLTVLADGKKIDIGNDYKITLDDNKVESPLKIGHTVVKREGASIRIENDKKGFFILCNFVHNYCSLSVSGFYYAKTGGLFGTFNYEPKLDMLTPTRHMASDIESFTKSWEVSQGSCRSNENLASIPGNDYRVQERCKSLFAKSSSEFRACFKQVDPEPFLKMCISDLSVVHERSFDEAICESAAAYFLQCKLEGVQLKLPNYCVRCEKQDGTMMKEGEALRFKHSDPITSADVVLLVEEKECNRERVRYLGKLAQSIEDNYKQKGIRDVRFSVVAFGGSDIHSAPHVHTLDGQISGPLRSLESAIGSLQFGDGPVNILEALRYAASLNFRPGTTKSFVLLKCSTCKSEEVKAEYSEMLRTLLDGDISLHMMSDHRYEIKNPNKNTKSRKIFGVDKSVAFTLKDVKDSRSPGDVDLLQQLKIPKDVCIPLAFEVSGSSFDAQFLTETKKSTNKKFMDVFARRVVKSSRTSSEWGMCCECIATVDGIGKSTCQRCVSAEIASMLSADETTAFRDFTDLPVKEKSKTRVRKHKERKSG